jgi:hypothetical protein
MCHWWKNDTEKTSPWPGLFIWTGKDSPTNVNERKVDISTINRQGEWELTFQIVVLRFDVRKTCANSNERKEARQKPRYRSSCRIRERESEQMFCMRIDWMIRQGQMPKRDVGLTRVLASWSWHFWSSNITTAPEKDSDVFTTSCHHADSPSTVSKYQMTNLLTRKTRQHLELHSVCFACSRRLTRADRHSSTEIIHLKQWDESTDENGTSHRPCASWSGVIHSYPIWIVQSVVVKINSQWVQS